jgi:predicted esterase
MIDRKEFARYDYGEKENLKRYGTQVPRKYKMSNIKDIPVALICGKEDLVCTPSDYNWLRAKLEKGSSCVHFSEYPLGHLGLLIPKEMNVHEEIIEVLKKN